MPRLPEGSHCAAEENGWHGGPAARMSTSPGSRPMSRDRSLRAAIIQRFEPLPRRSIELQGGKAILVVLDISNRLISGRFESEIESSGAGEQREDESATLVRGRLAGLAGVS